MEYVCPCLRKKYSALFSDKGPTLGWVFRMAAKQSVVAMQLMRVIGLRMAKAECSPLTPMHVKGLHNEMTDIPSRSFGSEPKWYCQTDDDLRYLFEKNPVTKTTASDILDGLPRFLCPQYESDFRFVDEAFFSG
ncbi:hypothetical protein ACHAWF_012825 [Thalassiosira exigua]